MPVSKPRYLLLYNQLYSRDPLMKRIKNELAIRKFTVANWSYDNSNPEREEDDSFFGKSQNHFLCLWVPCTEAEGLNIIFLKIALQASLPSRTWYLIERDLKFEMSNKFASLLCSCIFVYIFKRSWIISSKPFFFCKIEVMRYPQIIKIN